MCDRLLDSLIKLRVYLDIFYSKLECKVDRSIDRHGNSSYK